MACKTDLDESRQIEDKLGLKLAIVYGALYFESSGITEAFNIIHKLVALASQEKPLPEESKHFSDIKSELRSWNSKSRNSTEMIHLKSKLSLLSLKDVKFVNGTLTPSSPKLKLKPVQVTQECDLKSSLQAINSSSTMHLESNNMSSVSLPMSPSVQYPPNRSESLKMNALTSEPVKHNNSTNDITRHSFEHSSITMDGLINRLLSKDYFGIHPKVLLQIIILIEKSVIS